MRNYQTAVFAVLLACAALPASATLTSQLNFENFQNVSTVAYGGDLTNWAGVTCGKFPDHGRYQLCQGDLLGDISGNTRDFLLTPDLPFGSDGTYFEILDSQSAIIGVVELTPSIGCGGHLTCGLKVDFFTAFSGGALPPALLSTFATIPLFGTVIADGTNQTVFSLLWSDQRADNINVDFPGEVPEPSTTLLVAAGCMFCFVFARPIHLKRKQ